MKIKTSELIGPALDWAVAKCEGAGTPYVGVAGKQMLATLQYSTNWAQGGPIIQREKISIRQWANGHIVHAYMPIDGAEWSSDGDSPLIAAMRCYVASNLGDLVEIPNDMSCTP